MPSHIIKMSDFKAVKGYESLKTSSLGSCVGVILYDKKTKTGGMAHVMLPSSPHDDNNIGRYADKAIPELINHMIQLGAKPTQISAMLFGGADMFFSFSSTTSIMKIGFRNIEASKQLLKECKIPIVYEDIGGYSGRSVELDCESGTVTMRNLNANTELIRF